ncbi:MAG: twin-arginine translocase TatA/TatE family subunit [Hyphomicrobiales bacterium]
MILLGFFGGPEVILVIIAILILFGGRKIPELMKGLGKGIKEFKKATDENPVSGEIKDVKKEIDEVNDTIIESMDKENSKKTK